MPGSYCLAIHVPVYVDGPDVFATPEWRRALMLLRDSFAGRFERFIVVAPRIQAAGRTERLEPIDGEDGFDVRPSIPHGGGKRDYWLRERGSWRADVARALAESEIGHMGMGDLYRPINFDALRLSLGRPVTTVLVRDTDAVTQMRQLIVSRQIRRGPDRQLYLWAYERAMRGAARRAHLSLLKGRALLERYGGIARNPRMFQDTSYSEVEIVPAERVERRLATLAEERPLRLVYCGRLVARKGLDHAIAIVAGAAEQGARVTLDLIGAGPERASLERLAAASGAAVRFLGEKVYGPELIAELARYDALLFTPLAEDTPRMIFDGYAAGLPLVGYDIPYVRERAAEERAAVTIPAQNIEAGAGILAGLDRDRAVLRRLARAAHDAAQDNTAESWYGRRAEWTLEAHERRLRDG